MTDGALDKEGPPGMASGNSRHCSNDWATASGRRTRE